MSRPVIVVHGGAGTWPSGHREQALSGVKKAVVSGFDVLKRDLSALKAVEESVKCMEDDSTFNAGLGSVLTLNGQVEMDATIMDGRTLNAGAVALVTNVKNPVTLARFVMEKTDHVLMAAWGAEKLADLFKLERRDQLTDFRLKSWEEALNKLKEGTTRDLPRLLTLVKQHPEMIFGETVGAVALDCEGNMAAATSTGGLTLKLSGRVGDSALIGSGTYADNETGAVSTTGIGEVAIKLALAKTVCEYMRVKPTQTAAEEGIRLVNRRLCGEGTMGLIAINVFGEIGVAHNSQHLCWGYMREGVETPRVVMRGKLVKSI